MRLSKLFLIIIALVLLLIGSLFLRDLYFNRNLKPSNGGDDGYSALLQYEWPQLQGDSSFSRFSAGPAPETSDFLWKTNITGIQSYVSAFCGKVFVTTKLRFLLSTGKQEVSFGTLLCMPRIVAISVQN